MILAEALGISQALKHDRTPARSGTKPASKYEKNHWGGLIDTMAQIRSNSYQGREAVRPNVSP